jgi:hypothetical protein
MLYSFKADERKAHPFSLKTPMEKSNAWANNPWRNHWWMIYREAGQTQWKRCTEDDFYFSQMQGALSAIVNILQPEHPDWQFEAVQLKSKKWAQAVEA